MTDPPRILIVGPSWIGDTVIAQSLFISLKNQIPDCRIDVLAPAWTFSLLDRMPEVSKAIPMPVGHGQFRLGERKQIGNALIKRNYRRAIVLPSSWKSALIPFFAKIPVRTGYYGEFRVGLLNDIRRLDKRKLTQTVQRFVALGSGKNEALPPYCPFPKLSIQDENRRLVKRKFGVSDDKNVLGLCPGAEYGPAKRWPTEYFAEVADGCAGRGWQVWLFGSSKDKPVAREIKQMAEQSCHDFTGATTMAEAVDLMSLTECVLTNDSGLMHVAAALEKKTIAIYGSSDPKFTPPLSHSAGIVYLDLECSPCFKRECPFDHYRCLRDITPRQVLGYFDKLCAL